MISILLPEVRMEVKPAVVIVATEEDDSQTGFQI
jgi:hypothetical protein